MLKTFSFNCNGKSYTIFRKEKILDLKPEDFIPWLHTSSFYPKIFWKSKTKSFTSASVGSLMEFDHIPSNIPDGLHLYGACLFAKKSWKDFSINYVLPKHELIQKKNTFVYAVNSFEPLEEIFFEKPLLFNPTLPNIELFQHLPSFESWQQNIQKALDQIQLKVFDKVVLARCSKYRLKSKMNPLSLLDSLFKKTKNSYLFFFQKDESRSFFSISPEMLFSLQGSQITSEAIAGTKQAKRSNQDLLQSTKEILEFSFVKQSILKILKRLCKTIHIPSKTTLLHTTNLQHIYSRFSGILKEKIAASQLIHLFHPTPAVGGWPKIEALKFIESYEPFNRGYYSAPLLHLSGSEIEAVVGIRSCYISENIMQLFAGAGIVQGSHPKKEWDELNDKTAIIKDQFL